MTRRGEVTPDLPGPFSVQLLEGRWFVGPLGAMQRVEDAHWLATWLAANGITHHDGLDFAGDQELEQRFVAELGLSSNTMSTPSLNGETS
jgi:hypothetical protein